MDPAIGTLLFENGPGFGAAGIMFYMWQKEVKAREAAEKRREEIEERHVTDLKGQIALWQQLKGRINGAE